MNRTAVEQIKERLPIDVVIGQYIKLEKSTSASFKAKCPFHNEKTASFHVSPDRGGYYCFGCNAKGDIFSFVEQFEGLDFRGALKVLAERAGVPLVYDQKADSDRDRLFQIMEQAAAFFESQLEKNAEAKKYVTDRGIAPETKAEFRIGWAPEGWSNLYVFLKGKGWNDAMMERAGLIKKRDSNALPTHASPAGKNHSPDFSELAKKTKGELVEPKGGSMRVDGYYDRFRGRVMFPITDSSGRVIAFSGRILKDDGKSAKYLNSPDTPLYDKSLVLYGLDKAKSQIRQRGFTILVEGQMDLVLSHQAGVKNTVAASGTALTDESMGETGAVSNLGLVRRLSPNVIIAFDSDSAGRKAALRGAGIALSMGMDVKIADIEGGKDPADLVLHDPEDWKTVLRNAKPIIEFELGNVLREESDPRKIPRMLRERVFPFLARMDSAMDKAHFVKMIADKAQIADDAVWQDLRATEDQIKKAQSAAAATSASSAANSGSAARPLTGNAASSAANGAKAPAARRIDLVERRMFGLLSLMETAALPQATTYREQIQKIADTTYDEHIKKIEPIVSDITYEAEAMFGNEKEKWDWHMKELILNFEADLIDEDLMKAMQELRAAEKAGDAAKLSEMATKCQVLSIRKAEVGKRRK